MNAAPGEVAFVLHTHLPLLRGHGVWPVGEEWLFQAWSGSWLPVTEVLLRLAEDGHRDVLTLSVTPTVAEQVADARLRRDLGTWLGSQMWQAEEQRTGYGGPDRAAIRALGPFHWRHLAHLLDLHERVEEAGGLLAVWADLARRGVIEVLGGPATHPYLALMNDPALLDGQLATGLGTTGRWLGERPGGLWSPECSYRPTGPVADPTAEPSHVDEHGTPELPASAVELPGLESFWARHGISHVLVDAATLVRGAGGGERDWTRRPEVPEAGSGDPYEVVHDGVRIGDSEVVAFARDLSVAYHVWSPSEGYPGDPWYRDFHAQGGFGAHPSWRVTDKHGAAKRPYEPVRADERVRVHADHLHGVLRAVLDARPGQLVVAAYDTELFGHWWFEGPAWLEATLRGVAGDPRLRTTTLAGRLERRPPTRRLSLPESSWGYAKGHASWVTPTTRPLWAALRGAEGRFRRLVTDRAGAAGDVGDDPVALQAARDLAHAQASDWPFMITRGGSAGYAEERLAGHLARLHRLADAVQGGASADDLAALASELRERVPYPADPAPLVTAVADHLGTGLTGRR